MPMAATIPVIKLKLYPSPSALLTKVPQKPSFVVRCSEAEGPLRRPAAPSLSPPPASVVPSLSPPPSLSATPPVKPEAASLQSPVVAVGEVKGVVTLEYQRRMAKELQEYFRQKKIEEAGQGPFFGFMGKNEITNGSARCPAFCVV
ncbi:hypothetical protein HPP92_000590 [Vanilla planifolia]|uniref:Uncharacterized protein n=1 Tax=Vanilla planifolia TaxID=51239 RepID=A0A835S0W8_VANPL|nr:hypothetical protein HPP92_000590 [Vanilla planifolia]